MSWLTLVLLGVIAWLWFWGMFLYLAAIAQDHDDIESLLKQLFGNFPAALVWFVHIPRFVVRAVRSEEE